ncbi:MAG TPA: serine/threonine-protein kinase [Terriglobales bacterium]
MEPQDKIGQYTLIRKIGEGGMAEVWEARHDQLGSHAAIKFLLPEFARNKDLQERFLNEGKRQAQLQHPNIVPATDFFQVEGRSYLVMQYVEGQNLEVRLKKENPALTLQEVRSITSDILNALGYAHSMGVVHRDVKPSNMLIDPKGRVLLMDFGIALALTEEQRLTRTNTSMGTPDYMSPEQITRPLEVDFRSDIYSFGCVLYAMLSGNPPFTSEGATAFAIHDRHVRAAPPPLMYRNPEIPQTVSSVVLKCLQKDPANRYQTCTEIITPFEGALAGKGEKPQGSFLKYAIAGVAAIILIVAAVFFLKPTGDPQFERVKNTNWADVPYDYDFPNCRGWVPCQEKKDRAGKLLKFTNWMNIRYDDPILKDCMKLSACLERQAQAQNLLAVSDWKSITDKKLLGDCMFLSPCRQRGFIADPIPVPKSILSQSCAYVADNIDCCTLSNPTERNYCMQCKKKEQVTGGECGGVYRPPK